MLQYVSLFVAYDREFHLLAHGATRCQWIGSIRSRLRVRTRVKRKDIITLRLHFSAPDELDKFVRFWTHGLYTTLHNPIIVDFPRPTRVATLYSFQYTRLARFRAAPLPFQQVMSSR
jgi:hypothetical protein